MRTLVVKGAVDMVQNGKSPHEAIRISLDTIKEKTGFDGGMIILDRKGNYAAHYTTKAMPWVYKKG